MTNEYFKSAGPVALLPDYGKEAERFEIEPVSASALADVAEFLHTRRGAEKTGDPQSVRENAPDIERRLRWLLLQNPGARGRFPLGYCLWDRMGTIKGVTLTFPAVFLAGDKRLTGLWAGSFFVEPAARSMGFFLFRKYLASAGCSFFLATTCNANSAELWKSLGGRAVPNSDTEYFLPIRLDVMIPAYVATRTSSEVAGRLARIAGKWANPILRNARRPRAALTTEPCHDWDKLSELARRNRNTGIIAPDRPAEYLRWRYGAGSPQYPCDIHVFRDKKGNEGWFSLGSLIRGEQGQIRASVLLDAVWPREKMGFKDIFEAIVRRAARGSDAVFFPPKSGIDCRQYSRWLIPRRFGAPRAFVISRNAAPPLSLDSFDYDDIDNAAWTFLWR